MRRLALCLLPLTVACSKATKTTADTPVTTVARPVEAPLVPVAMPKAEDTARLAKANNAFAFDLYGKLRGADGNQTFSPLSLNAALTMTYGGARGETAAQMKRALHIDSPNERVMSDWGTLARALQTPGRPTTLRIANRLFGEKTEPFEPAFLRSTEEAYGAPLEPLDFKKAFGAARTRINTWVEERTEKRIRDLLPPTGVSAATRLVLVNAMYFLADWAEPFDVQATQDDVFRVTQSQQQVVKMMHQRGHFRFAEAGDVRMVELPYKGQDTAMVVVLPTKVDGLKEIEESLTEARFSTWMGALKMQNVDVALPKFEVNPAATLSLSSPLKQLGIVDAFNMNSADFSGIAKGATPNDRLHIEEVFHKAFVKVDERGTEAAAASAVAVTVGAAAPSQPLDFHADHPFLFAIIDKPSGLILFFGRIADPTKS
jgi:serpin B